MKPWLLLDVSYLAYRAFYSTPNLSFNDIPTAVAFGVLRDILTFQDTFDTDKLAFCFDHGKPLRKLDYPTYKANREADEEKIAVRKQVGTMRKDYLPSLGFQNIFAQKGYEADDIIAKIILDRPDKEFVIVSSDKDLYQLLDRDRVRIWNPKTHATINQNWLEKEFGVGPMQWADVKALAGCSTDNIEGIRGVGEKTAAKYLNGTLKPTSKVYQKIVHDTETWKGNIGLVTLPYFDIEPMRLVKDEVTTKKWEQLLRRLGMNSLGKFIHGGASLSEVRPIRRSGRGTKAKKVRIPYRQEDRRGKAKR